LILAKFQTVNLKKIALNILLYIVVVIISFTIEFSSQTNLVSDIQASVFQLSNPAQSQNLAVSYDENANPDNLQKFTTNKGVFPTYFKASDDLQIEIFGDTFLSLAKDTELRTLIFTKDKLHLQLVKGAAILDTRQSRKRISIQTNNILLKPYLRGIYVLDKTTELTQLYADTGQALLGVYSKNGNLKDKILLPKKNLLAINEQLDLETYELTTQVEPLEFYKQVEKTNLLQNLDSYLQKHKAFVLTNKGLKLSPSKSQSFLAGLSSKISFNPQKRNFNTLYNFVKELNSAQNEYLNDQVSQGNIALQQAFQNYNYQIQTNPLQISAYTGFINKVYLEYIGLNPKDKLLPIKVDLIEQYSSILNEKLKEKYLQEAILSYLEDLYYYYQNNSVALAEETGENLIKVEKSWTALQSQAKDEDLIYLIKVIDNILFTFPKSNNKITYQLRTQIYQKIEISDYKFEYQGVNSRHLKFLQENFEAKTMPNSYVKESLEILTPNLSEFTQLQYEEFFNQVDTKSLG